MYKNTRVSKTSKIKRQIRATEGTSVNETSNRIKPKQNDVFSINYSLQQYFSVHNIHMQVLLSEEGPSK